MYGDPKFTFPYVPSHLHHMIFELVKNSLRAVQDKYDNADDDEEAPPIRCGCGEVWGSVAGEMWELQGTWQASVGTTQGHTAIMCRGKLWDS